MFGSMNCLPVHINQDKKERIKTKIRTQQYIQLNTGVKEIQQLNLSGPDNRHRIRPKPYMYHLKISLKVGNVIESEVQLAGVQLKRKAKLPTVIGLTTKHAVCCSALML